MCYSPATKSPQAFLKSKDAAVKALEKRLPRLIIFDAAARSKSGWKRYRLLDEKENEKEKEKEKEKDKEKETEKVAFGASPAAGGGVALFFFLPRDCILFTWKVYL